MADIVNLMDIETGQAIRLSNDATVEVVSNPRDGVWLFVRYLSNPDDPEQVGEEDMVFAQDIVEVLAQ
jgi:hypothetical protein